MLTPWTLIDRQPCFNRHDDSPSDLDQPHLHLEAYLDLFPNNKRQNTNQSSSTGALKSPKMLLSDFPSATTNKTSFTHSPPPAPPTFL